eukprot:TRINITY_DN3273_c0_g1_i3.p1 TRINITY_DN3273_c0_g1~~TRINITY_DN3273_c0_g1_i3.p1  ORF type:complete len:497 (-),score=116.61 TRINITY_DN3273_c0_g1_i3:90-1580(-)
MWLFALFGLAVFTLFRFFWRPWSTARHFRSQGVSGYPFVPFVGQLPSLIKDASKETSLLKFYTDGFEKYGDTFYFFHGSSLRFASRDPSVAQEVLSKKSKFYRKLPSLEELFGSLAGKGILFSEGALWKKQRSVINMAFTLSNVKRLMPLMVQRTDISLNSLLEQCERSNNRTISNDVSKFFSSLTLDIIGGAAFGEAFSADSGIRHAMYDTLGNVFANLSAQGLRNGIPLGKHIPTKLTKEIADQVAFIHGMVDEVIQDRKSGRTKALLGEQDLLDMILTGKYETGETMSDELVRHECVVFVLAGHETTSNFLAWFMHSMCLYPEALELVQKEIAEVVGNQVPTLELLAQLPVLESVLNETFRLNPVLTWLGRYSLQEHTVGNVTIPADVSCQMMVYHIHRHPTYWEEPETFQPLRFLRDTEHGRKRHPASFMPFGAGPRMCVGSSFAFLEAKVIVVMLLQRFNFKLSAGQKIVPQVAITLRARYGITLELTPRN